jgi:death on curing protein
VTSAADAIDYLSVDDLLEIAEGILDEVAMRDFGLLSSAAARPQTSVFGSDAYPSFSEKTAALMHSLARNHALVDGDKRLAWAATRVFCLLNDFDISYQIDDAEQTVLAVAAGEIDAPEIAKWIADQLR